MQPGGLKIPFILGYHTRTMKTLSLAWIFKFFKLGLLPIAYLIMILVVFFLPFFSAEEYSISHNTTSHLGAQNTPNAWIMNVVFVLLGIASIIDGWERLPRYWMHKAVITIFGISLILTAFFQHAPIIPGAIFSEFEDGLHSKFATITGFSFTFFTVAAAFVESTKLRKVIALGIGVLAILLTLLIFNLLDNLLQIIYFKLA